MDTTVTFTQEKKDDILILRLKGRLDAISSPQAEKQVMTSIDEGTFIKVLMNFEEIDYLSSAGMRLLLTTTKKMKTKNGKFVIVSISDGVMEVIKMAGFDHILNVRKTEKEGLAEF